MMDLVLYIIDNEIHALEWYVVNVLNEWLINEMVITWMNQSPNIFNLA